jgi:hypothetical protein
MVLQILVAVSRVESCHVPRPVQKCLTHACLRRFPPAGSYLAHTVWSPMLLADDGGRPL